MPKIHKKQFNKKAFLKIVIPTCVIAFAVLVGVAMIVQQRDAAHRELEATNGARDALVHAFTEDLTPAAPVDAKTGDTYFPALRLYLPYTQEQDSLDNYIYQVDGYGDKHPEPVINVSTRRTVSAATSDLYNARDLIDLYNKVPHAQSCVRGVSLAIQPIKNLGQGNDQMRRKLHHKQVLDDGRELYFYYEPGCSELTKVIDQLNGLRTYRL